MAETLKEIVARASGEALYANGGGALRAAFGWQDGYERRFVIEQTAMITIAALRNPPPETIEAGAKAMWIEIDSATGGAAAWAAIDQAERNYWMHAWLASWRAAINVR